MRMLELGTLRSALVGWAALGSVIVACGPVVPGIESDTASGTGTSTTSGTAGDATLTEGADDAFDDTLKHDEPWGETEDTPLCETDGTCDQIDLVIVVDNSSTMGEEQRNLARNFPLLVDSLMELTDADGDPVNPSVNIMVTTTDFGHPLCTAFEKPDYEPRQGAPVYTGCNSRIERFTSNDPLYPLVIEEACTSVCPVDVEPSEPFINFDAFGSNVPGDDVRAALSCIGPQGIDGCGFESPLETMLHAIDETACWNDPTQPQCAADPEWAGLERGFLREGAMLALAIITDEHDCSVNAPDGYSYFTDDATYWEVSPDLGLPEPSSAICFNAGVSCVDGDDDGTYESCTASDSEVLHPIERYTEYLRYLREERGKEVVMLGMFGVPPVVAHNPEPPYEPIAGGAIDLVYRQWQDFPFPAGDILPDQWGAGIDAADKEFELGALGPGCTGTDDTGAFTGQALPPVRLREVCESLDYVDENGDQRTACCIESICDNDYSPAIRCLTGAVSESLEIEG